MGPHVILRSDIYITSILVQDLSQLPESCLSEPKIQGATYLHLAAAAKYQEGIDILLKAGAGMDNDRLRNYIVKGIRCTRVVQSHHCVK